MWLRVGMTACAQRFSCLSGPCQGRGGHPVCNICAFPHGLAGDVLASCLCWGLCCCCVFPLFPLALYGRGWEWCQGAVAKSVGSDWLPLLCAPHRDIIGRSCLIGGCHWGCFGVQSTCAGISSCGMSTGNGAAVAILWHHISPPYCAAQVLDVNAASPV